MHKLSPVSMYPSYLKHTCDVSMYVTNCDTFSSTKLDQIF